jgi:dolichyl-phosphate beta-glucosyltransferase
MQNPYLSIILPAYNEEERLPDSLNKIVRFLELQPYSSEVIVVENGSQDDTAAVVRQFSEKYPFISLISIPKPGKGRAVRTGMLAARGDYLFFADVDLSMPIEGVRAFLPPVCRGYDIAIGSREVPEACRFNEPGYRHLMGRIFNYIIRILAVRGFDDTQAGFKCFRREVAQAIFPYQTIDGWAFDVELLHIAQKHRYRIVEVPIQWYFMENSRVRPVEDTINMIREVWRIRSNSLAGRYDIRPDKPLARSVTSSS